MPVTAILDPGPETHVQILFPVMIRLADEGVPLNCIARAVQLPLAMVHATINGALEAARIIERPPNEWPQKQPTSQRAGHPTRFHDQELVTILQHHYSLTRQQAILLAVLLKKPCATKENLHAATQLVHEADHESTCPKLVDVVICKLRRKLARHGYSIVTIWASGYYVSVEDRKEILQSVGLTLPIEEPKPPTPVPVSHRRAPRLPGTTPRFTSTPTPKPSAPHS